MNSGREVFESFAMNNLPGIIEAPDLDCYIGLTHPSIPRTEAHHASKKTAHDLSSGPLLVWPSHGVQDGGGLDWCGERLLLTWQTRLA